jgi:type IV fimbrial biogenesis protein FimT
MSIAHVEMKQEVGLKDTVRIAGNAGITLIELIVVVTVVGILIVALGFEFTGWMGKYNVESQMKEMYIDLMNARARAMQKNRVHFVTLTATSYRINEDLDPWPDGDGVLTANDNTRPAGYNEPIPLRLITLASNIPITWSDISDAQIDFTKRGLSVDTKTVCASSTMDSDYDCIEISPSRIDMGKLTTKIPSGGACNATNCVSK